MMHRVLSHWDALPIGEELHTNAVGISLGLPPASLGLINSGGWLNFWKINPKIFMGFLRGCPMGYGHDAGPPRLHILWVFMIPDPPPFPQSVSASLWATGCAGVRPMFTAHKVQIKIKGDFLPVHLELLPQSILFTMASLTGYAPGGFMSVLFCGSFPNLISPIIPTQYSVFAGMTMGDVIGGFVDMFLTVLVDQAIGLTGIVPGVEGLIGAVLRVCTALGMSTGIYGAGVIVQQVVDYNRSQDTVKSDAPIQIIMVGFGWEVDQDASPDEPSKIWHDGGITMPYQNISLPWSF